MFWETTLWKSGRAQGTDRYRLPHQLLVGTFVVDWVMAAERYRGWALQQPWALESRLRRGLVPSWIQDTGVWVWNRGRSTSALQFNVPPDVKQESVNREISGKYWRFGGR